MNDKIFYIKAQNQDEIFVLNTKISKIKTSWKKYINGLCIENLSTLEGRLNGVKLKYGWTQHIPIYICDKIILFYVFPIKYASNYFINVAEVKDIWGNTNKTYITFSNLETISLNISFKKVKSYYEKAYFIFKNL